MIARVSLFLLLLLLASSVRAQEGHGVLTVTNTPEPPAQSQSGPGGKEAAHAAVIAELHGTGAQAYWLFEPAKPTPQQAPLIVFNHGWAAMDPRIYKAWIDHIVKRGSIVVFPLYQESLLTAAKDFTPNAIAAVLDAMRTLQNAPGHVKPQLEKFAIVGHSMGGAISANMAALWKASGLPFPRVVMCVEPGKTWGGPDWLTIRLADLSQIPAGTLLLTVTGDQDHLVRDIDAKRIFNEATQVPLANKNYATLISDARGEPALMADHLAPVAWGEMQEVPQRASTQVAGSLAPPQQGTPERREVGSGVGKSGNASANRTLDAFDYYGTWKLFDGLTDGAFYGRNRKYGLGNTPEQRFMGVWSDGVPVKELKVTTHP